MECRKTQYKIDRYWRGGLSGEVADEVEAHLETCPECREALENARRLQHIVGRASTPPVPDGFASTVRERADERHDTILPLPSWRSLSAPWRTAVAASVVVGLGLGFIMGAGPQEAPRENGPEVAEATGLDYLSDSPQGSINRAYLNIIYRPENRE